MLAFRVATLLSVHLVAEAVTLVLVDFSVLLPGMFVSPVIYDPCTRLGWVRAEHDLVADEISRRFGRGWAVVPDSESSADDLPSNATGSVDSGVSGTGTDAVLFKISYHDTECSDTVGPLAAIEINYRDRDESSSGGGERCLATDFDNETSTRTRLAVDDVIKTRLFYGPCCKYALSPVARYSRHWNVPVITPGGTARAFSNRTTFPLLVRMNPGYDKLGEFLAKWLSSAGCRRTAMLYHENLGEDKVIGSSECYHVINAISNVLHPVDQVRRRRQERCSSSNGLDQSPYCGISDLDDDDDGDPEYHVFDVPHYEHFNENQLHKFNLTEILADIISFDAQIRRIMIQAAEQNMTNGNYIFFNIDLYSSQSKLERPWYDSTDTNERNDLARTAFQSVITITSRKPNSSQYQEFTEQVKRNARREYGGDTALEDDDQFSSVALAAVRGFCDDVQQKSWVVASSLTGFIGTFHDAVILYGLALNDTLSAGLDPNNGSVITQYMLNRTFEGITGTVSIDENGERNSDYSVLDMNPNNGLFELVANYDGNTQTYIKVEGKDIHWGADRTTLSPWQPSDSLESDCCACSLQNSPRVSPGVFVAIFIGVFLFIIAPAVVMVHRCKAARVTRSRLTSSRWIAA